MPKKLLSIIIPCYNEKNTIRKMLEKVEFVKLPQGVAKEILIVDDASQDGSREILKEYELKPDCRIFYHSRNKGKGAALKTGFAGALGDFLVVQDADLEYDPEELPGLLEILLKSKEKTAVFGSRNLKKNRTSAPLYKLGAGILTKFFNLLFHQKLTDLFTCYKMFPREALAALNLKESGFGFEAEISCQLIKAGYKIKEVPISYYPRSFAEGKKIRWSDGLKGLAIILKQRFRT